jgi:hypothetical protein
MRISAESTVSTKTILCTAFQCPESVIVHILRIFRRSSNGELVARTEPQTHAACAERTKEGTELRSGREAVAYNL